MPTINIPDLTERNKIGVDVNYPLNGDYLQTAEIDGTAGVLVIGTGNGALRFAGVYNANGFKTINVTIDNPTLDYQGLFGSTVGATISNIADVTGTVTGKDYVGGIIGRAYTSAVSFCKCSAAASAANYAGGVVGISTSTITHCYATGNATATASNAGGVIGLNGGLLINCYATGNATAAVNYAGGLIGIQSGAEAIFTSCFATGNFSGTFSNRLCGRDSSSEISTGACLTIPQAKDPSIYIAFDWDFIPTTGVWVMPIAMPNIVGKTVPTATALLAAQGCTLSITSSIYHATIPAGQIITQSIAAGGTAGFPQLQAHGMPDSPRTGDVVAVTVSLGSQVIVPNVLGKTEADAISLLSDFYFGATVTEATSEDVVAGVVMAQNPTGGLATYQSNVAITVSTGHANVVVPDVTGIGFAEAVAAIDVANLTPVVYAGFSSTVPLGYIIAQTPAAGASVAYDSGVDITVSLGVETAVVPDVVGKIEVDAIAAIEAVDLVAVITRAYDALIPSGTVVSQTPDADTTIETGADVCIVVSKGVEPKIVPGVEGKYYLAAQALIENVSLIYASTLAYHASVPSGYVISQSPAAGALVADGSTVTATVSRGASTGPMTYTMNTVKTVLSRSVAFRTWADVATEALALGHIGIYSESSSALPMAIVSPGNWEREVVTLDGKSLTKAVVVIEFCKGVTRSDSNASVFAMLVAAVDSIMLDIEAQGLWLNLKWSPLNEDTPRRADFSATAADWVSFSVVIEGDENEEI